MSTPDRRRLADADRDRLAELVGRHFLAGSLDAAALDERVGTIYGAQFFDEADAALADLPSLDDDPARPPERRRWWQSRGRHGEADRPEPGWRPTPERFVDPTTGRLMRVWVEPAGGARHYVADA